MKFERKFETTKAGFPAIWEQGGGCRNTGDAILVADRNGKPKKATYVRKSGTLSNDRHALIVVGAGDLVVDAYHGRDDFEIEIGRIVEIDREEGVLTLEVVNKFDRGEWDRPLASNHRGVVDAAMAKARDYHCRVPYWVKTE